MGRVRRPRQLRGGPPHARVRRGRGRGRVGAHSRGQSAGPGASRIGPRADARRRHRCGREHRIHVRQSTRAGDGGLCGVEGRAGRVHECHRTGTRAWRHPRSRGQSRPHPHRAVGRPRRVRRRDRERLRHVRQGNHDHHIRNIRRIPLGRPGDAREIADSIVFLASRRSRFTTGSALAVHGGMATHPA